LGWRDWEREAQLSKPDGADDIALACEGPASFTTMALDRKAQWRRTESALVGFGGAPMLGVTFEGVPLMMVYRTR
jgi:hypothetical protein